MLEAQVARNFFGALQQLEKVSTQVSASTVGDLESGPDQAQARRTGASRCSFRGSLTFKSSAKA